MIFFLAAGSYYDADLRIDVVRQTYDLLRQNEIDEYWLQYLYCVHLRNGDIASWVYRGVKGISKEEKDMLVQAARKIRNGALHGSTLGV